VADLANESHVPDLFAEAIEMARQSFRHRLTLSLFSAWNFP
jgi:hypothetical protein